MGVLGHFHSLPAYATPSRPSTTPGGVRAASYSAGSYVAAKMSGLQGYSSPFTPRMM